MGHTDTGAGFPSPPANTPGDRQPRGQGALRQDAARLTIGLITLLTLADYLFWGHAPGLSLALFAGAIFATGVWIDAAWRQTRLPAMLLTAAALPVIEHVQALSIAFLAAGLLTALVWTRSDTGWQRIGPRCLGLLLALPHSGLTSLAGSTLHLLSTARARKLAQPGQIMRDWAFPLGGALVLTTLLIEANPVLEQGLTRVLNLDVDLDFAIRRILFWAGLGLALWPLIATSSREVGIPRPDLARRAGINPSSVRKALILFNLILSVQTILDLSIFLGGAALPEGMSYATYAHRGAYPLLATAVLAGGFAVAAQPFLGTGRALRGLMLLWLAQNLALSLSSALRLDLYIAAYGLTYLRLHALIWIGMVATGLMLTGWQTLRALPTPWLIRRGAILSLSVLYACCFVNFAALIARENLSRWPHVDTAYLCQLGPAAGAETGRAAAGDPRIAFHLKQSGCDLAPTAPADWREWGYRQWRVARYGGAELTGMRDETAPRR